MKRRYPETVLHLVWLWQWRLPELLATDDGREVEVLNPGWWRYGPGPDFEKAVFRIGPRWYNGDIEVHHTSRDWYRHGHARDPAYRRVLLHVVYQRDGLVFHHHRPHRSIPQVDLSTYLDTEELDELLPLPGDHRPRGPQCVPYLARWDRTELEAFVRHMGLTFLQLRGRSIDLRPTPEQALYRRLLRALGYTQYKERFARLAAAIPWSRFEPLARRNPEQALQVLLLRLGWLPSYVGLDPDPEPEILDLGLTQPPMVTIPRWAGSVRPNNDPIRRLAWFVAFVHAAGPDEDPLRQLRELCAHLLHERRTPAHDARFWQSLMQRMVNLDWAHLVRPFAQDLGVRRAGHALGRARWSNLWWNAILPVTLAYTGWDARFVETIPRMNTGPMEEDWIQRAMRSRFAAYAAWLPRREPLVQLGLHALFRLACNSVQVSCWHCPLKTREIAGSPPVKEPGAQCESD